MPGPTTERLDSDLQILRNDIQDVRIDLARLGSKIDDLQQIRTEVAQSKTDLNTLSTQFRGVIAAGRWLGGIFLLAIAIGVLNYYGRLIAVEVQVKSIDTRLGGVETQVKSIDTRLGTVESEIKEIKTILGGIKEAIDRRVALSPDEQDERFRRIARAVVDEAMRRPEAPKPDVKP